MLGRDSNEELRTRQRHDVKQNNQLGAPDIPVGSSKRDEEASELSRSLCATSTSPDVAEFASNMLTPCYRRSGNCNGI